MVIIDNARQHERFNLQIVDHLEHTLPVGAAAHQQHPAQELRRSKDADVEDAPT